ncbi:hypothetical protein LTR94_035021, partial [Friedmanniomyces endolithicus]
MVGPGVGVDRDEGRGHLRHLGDGPVAILAFADADDGARGDPDVLARLGGQGIGRESEPGAADGDFFALQRIDQHFLRARLEHDGRQQAVAAGALLQRVDNRFLAFLGFERQHDARFRAAVAMALV